MNAEDQILECLSHSDIELEPKIIAFRTGLSHNTVKGTVRRLLHKHLIVRDVAGYQMPKAHLDDHLGKLLQLDGTDHTLPKVHDIHLTFKPKNIADAMKNPEIWDPIRQVSYSLGNRGPVDKESRKAYKQSYKTIASLSGIDWLDQLANPLDPDSIFCKWETTAHNASGIKGGYQESFDFKEYRVKVMLYWTGTIKVIISNSEHPFDAVDFKRALDKIDGLFVSRIGVRFADISNLFYIEKVHIGNDVVGDREFSGTTRLCCTINELDTWIYRCYEKILGDSMVVRNEACMEAGGNFKEHNLGAFQAFLTGNLMPQLINSQIFMLTKNQDADRELMRRQQNEIHDLGKAVKDLMGQIARDHQSKNDQPAPAAAPVITPGPSSPGASPAQRKIDGTGPDKELASEKVGAYLGKLKQATKKAAPKSTPLTKEETWQVLEAFEKIRKKEGS